MSELTLQQAFDLAFQAHQRGQIAEARNLYLQIIAFDPRHSGALHLLGVLAQQEGNFDAAIDFIQRSLAINPRFAEAQNNLGVSLRARRRFDEAIAAYHKAIELNPKLPDAHSNLGNVLKDKGLLDQSVAASRKALSLDPNYAEAMASLANALKDKGELEEAIDYLRKAVARGKEFPGAHSDLILTLHYHAGVDPQIIGEELRQWNLKYAAPLNAAIRPHTNDRSPNRRLRIGYVSPDFREHPVARFLLPLLANHDKTQVECFAYAQVPAPDAVTEQLRAHVDNWCPTTGLSDAQLADRIRQDQIDILIDLAMHTVQNRLLVFAQKPAPVQVTYLAYSSSTGLDTIDYRLSDPFLDPASPDSTAPSFYSEKTILLPETYWCYQPSSLAPEVSPLPALAQGHITFGCLNNFCKVSPTAIDAWSKILRAVPNSQLLIHSKPGAHRKLLLDYFQHLGLRTTRIRFSDSLPLADYLKQYHSIDIALDTFPFNGGTTTCDALYMGVPVISLVGQLAVGRAGLSLLSNIGHPEFAAPTIDFYIQTTIALASDLPHLSNLRAILRPRMQQSPLMNAPRFAQNMETVLRQMWHNWCRSA